ncbi:ABC transporter ATP-binding protein [Haliovirga abyssi]|uniref:ABC transporter ATP-binding protein n=1 Tax=Haliovirga abyssi TaxID=2996794 RepID=A0AAU9DEQ1_9FUSO|nr:ABC transporter ATP-binding protein [Haliovirga abyssi]BDU49822.1 ABC transporter ATP-binding protein [Haliovirga abyssi]
MTVLNEEEFNEKIDFGIWKKILEFAKPYRKHMILLAVVMIIVGAQDVAIPLMTKYAIDHFINGKTTSGLYFYLGVYILLAISQAFHVRMLIVLAGKIDSGTCYQIRKAGFNRLQELSFTYYDKTAVGWMMARLTSDVQKLGDMIAWGMVDIVWGFTVMIGIAGVMVVLNWKLAIFALSAIPALLFISKYFQNKILGSYREVRKLNSKITSSFNEGISGAKTTKALACEPKNINEFKNQTGEMYSASVRAAIFSSLYLPIVISIGSIGTALVLWKGGNAVSAGAITFGTLTAFLAYTIQFFDPLREIARVISEFQSAQAAAERVISLVKTEPDIVDNAEVIEKYGTSNNPKKENWEEIEGEIEFENVSFAYKKGEQVLKNFNLKVKKGEKIAIVGETGSGKSTIVNLICRFYEPNEGRIIIDGKDYKDRSLGWLHSRLGYVLQSPHLFSGTIMENIRYGKLEASDEEIIEAAKLAKADEFIEKMENGYNTEVGEGGSRLSTGEKQLISFARAILADPKIFVLDEATSSVDTETEKKIQEATEMILEKRTSFIIAHRLSTIKNADRILVIDNGKMIEEGSHHELILKKGHYFKLYSNQFIEENEVQYLSN